MTTKGTLASRYSHSSMMLNKEFLEKYILEICKQNILKNTKKARWALYLSQHLERFSKTSELTPAKETKHLLSLYQFLKNIFTRYCQFQVHITFVPYSIKSLFVNKGVLISLYQCVLGYIRVEILMLRDLEGSEWI